MLNILKYFQQGSVENYEFQEAEHLSVNTAPPQPQQMMQQPQQFAQQEMQMGVPNGMAVQQQSADFAKKLQESAEREAEQIIAHAKEQAAVILETARSAAKREAQALCEDKREEGYQEGFAEGREAGYRAGQEQAMEESRTQIEAQQQQTLYDIERFFRDATDQRDMMFVRAQDQMRDLALTVAEKVLRISLQSSGEIVARMIQHATEKLKRREWVRVYISKGDAQRCVQADIELAHSLASLSDHVKIVPMESEDPGTCIIEMPDEIIDASASTQMENIRNMLEDMKT